MVAPAHVPFSLPVAASNASLPAAGVFPEAGGRSFPGPEGAPGLGFLSPIPPPPLFGCADAVARRLATTRASRNERRRMLNFSRARLALRKGRSTRGDRLSILLFVM